jgi:hypothetical protein
MNTHILCGLIIIRTFTHLDKMCFMSVDETETCSPDDEDITPKVRRSRRDSARWATMSPVSRALLNKRRRDSYVSKKRLFKTPQEKADRRRQVNKDYNKRAKEQRENNLHPDSIAMANPQWKPELLFPPGAKPSSRVSEEMVIPDFSGNHVYVEVEVREPPQ